MKPLLLPLYLTMCLTIQAQIFPIQVTPQLVPPYSPYLSDYTAPGAQALLIHIRTNDITLSGYAVKLRFTIEGVGITIRTNPHFNPSPIILEGGGVQQTFQGVDLYEYFDPYALDFSGYSRNEYQKRARLPEGLYRFTVEVLDFNRGTLVSNAGTTMAWIVLNDPPMLNSPTNFSKVPSGDPTNILFSWTPRHSGSPNAAFTTEYTFRLIEVWPENRNPYDAFLTQVPLFEITTAQHQLLYSTSEPALVHGRKYAWQVQSRDTEGRDLFKNNGRSEVFIFQYGEALAVPQNFQLRWAKPTTLSVRWDPVHHDSEEIKYRLQYRPRLRRENHEWYETRTQFTEKTLYQLQADTDYEMRVRAERITQESAYTETMVFRTLRPEKEEFVCKDPVTPPPSPANTHPVFPLSVNDTLHAGGFRVLVRDVLEVEGKYFGSGVAIVPWLNAAKVRVTFENIRVNDRFWLIAGTVKSVWSAGSSFLLEEHTPLLPGTTPEVGELDITVVEADSLITISGAAIASVTHDEEGNIVVATTDGKQHTLARGDVYAITDEVGNGYIVDEKGNVAKTTASQASAAAARGNRKYDLQFRFAQGQGLFGFDEQKYEALSAHYQQLKGGQPVAWKALSSAAADQLEGSLQSPEIDARRIRFESGSASVTPLSAEQGVVKLSLFGKMSGMEEELVALYSPADSLADNVLGKINLVTYDPVHYKLEIVPVNGAAMPATVTPGIISERLNFIYRQAVVSWQVNLATGIQVALPAKFDEGQSGLFSNYTADMKKVLNAWGRLQDDTYYLFLIDEPVDPQTLGYMPRNRQAGFVFVRPHQGNGEEFLKTIAHELGHGAFNLKHTFSEYNLPPGTTNNLMDYSPGTALYKYQWDHIHDPGKVVGWFDGEGEGASVVVTNMSQLKAFANPDGSYTFLSPTGIPFTLPASTQAIKFWTNDVYADGVITMDDAPDGALIAFTVGDVTYRYHKILGEKMGSGYKVSAGDPPYTDHWSKKLQGLDEAIIGLPCVEGGHLRFIARKVRFHSQMPSENFTAQGTIQEKLPIEDPYDVEYTTEKIFLEAALDFTYTEEALDFLSDNETCMNEMTHYVVKAADVIQRFPGYYTRYKTCDPYPLKFPKGAQTQTEEAFLLGQYYEKLKHFPETLLNYVNQTQYARQELLTVQEAGDLAELLKTSCESDFTLFTFEERRHIITLLAEGNLHDYWIGIGNNRENIVIYALAQAPEDQFEQLLDLLKENEYALLKTLVRKCDNQLIGEDNFDRLIDAVTVMIQKTSVYEAFEEDIAENRIIRWGNQNGFSFFRYDVNGWLENSGKENIVFSSSNIDHNISGVGEITGVHFTTTETPYPAIEVSPFDFVALKLYNDVTLDNGESILKRSAGEFQAVPAIYLYWMIQRKATDQTLAQVRAQVNVLLFLVGGAEIMAARTGLRLTLAIIDQAFFSTSFVLAAGPRKVLEEGPHGEEWVSIFKTFDAFNLLYGTVRLGQGLSLAAEDILAKQEHIRQLKALENWDGYPPAMQHVLQEQFAKIERGMDELEDVVKGYTRTDAAEVLRTLLQKLPSKVQARILQLPDKQIESFLRDLENSPDLLRHFNEAEMVDGWAILANNAVLRKEPENLKILGYWAKKGVDKERLIEGIAKAGAKQKLINRLKNAKSKFHVQVHIKDYENIPGVVRGRYVPNGSTLKDKAQLPADWESYLDLSMGEMDAFTGHIKPLELKAGDKIYRVSSSTGIDGKWWSFVRPTTIAEVIGGSAVKPRWNNFERINEYTIPEGITIRCWTGKAARQKVDDKPSNYYLPGGSEQIFIPFITNQDKNFNILVKSTDSLW